LRILEVPRAVGVRSQIQDRFLKYEGLDDHLPVQERSDTKFGVDPRHLDNITGRKYRRVLHAEMIDVNRFRPAFQFFLGDRRSPGAGSDPR
jgi:hypothetical protein